MPAAWSASGTITVRTAVGATLALVGTAIVAVVAAFSLWSVSGSTPADSDEPVDLEASRDHTGKDQPTGDRTSASPFAVWGHNADGGPIRWDPCRPIKVAISPDGGPDGWIDDLEEALRRVDEATALTFDIVGTTPERPRSDRSLISARNGTTGWAPVLIAWASPGETDLDLGHADRGLAIPVAIGTAQQRTFVTGQIVFNAQRAHFGTHLTRHDHITTGWDDRSHSWGATILHEVMHLVGLDHVDDPNELMYGPPGEGPIEFGPGDKAGLAYVAGDADCIEVPAVERFTSR